MDNVRDYLTGHYIGEFDSVRCAVESLQPDYPLYCVRFQSIIDKTEEFVSHFPGDVMYAVKCNPHLDILKTMVRHGMKNFDVASLSELELIKKNFPDARCYFMHPAKSREAIKKAYFEHHVVDYVVDHMSEVDKILGIVGTDVRIFVRIKPQQYGAAFTLSDKFGATEEDAIHMLQYVKEKGAKPAIAFHVGSQCRDKLAFKSAIHRVRHILDQAHVDIDILDVGGGFPVPYVGDVPEDMSHFFATIREACKEVGLDHVKVVCEPGRALVAESYSLLVRVMLRKGDEIHINEGVWHSLYEALMGGICYPMRVIRLGEECSNRTKPFTIFGQTCDNTDVVSKDTLLAEDVREGDWIEIGQAGAYTHSMTGNFNGFTTDKMILVNDEPFFP